MHKMAASVFLCLVAGVAMIRSAGGQAPKAGEDKAAKVDQLVKKWSNPAAPGCVVVVVSDGQVVYQHSGGLANLEFGIPLSLSTVFLIASLSKQFTAFAIFMLAQGGKLSLDDDVRKYIPELPKFGKTIKVQHLVHHTSGLREYTALAEFAGWRGEDVMTEDDFMSLVCRQKELNFDPGAEYNYSNTNYHLLGMIVRKVSGKSLAEFSREKIFEPLGMKETIFRDDFRQVIKNAAASYSPDRDGFAHEFIANGISGATNVHTTAGDLVIWDRNFYDGKVGGKKAVEAMQTRGKLNDGTEVDYAGGLYIGKYRGQKTVEHGGAHGGFRTALQRFPEHRLTIIALANVSDFPDDITDKIADVFLEEKLGPAKKKFLPKKDKKDAQPFPVSAEQMKELAGDFYSEELDVVYHVVVKDGKLLLRHRKGESELKAVSSEKYNCDIVEDGSVEFKRDAARRVSSFLLSEPSCRHVRFVRVTLPGPAVKMRETPRR